MDVMACLLVSESAADLSVPVSAAAASAWKVAAVLDGMEARASAA
jgi:hypothetical protein